MGRPAADAIAPSQKCGYDTAPSSTTPAPNPRTDTSGVEQRQADASRSSMSRAERALATKGGNALPIIAGDAEVATKSQRIKQAMLPNRGRIRNVP